MKQDLRYLVLFAFMLILSITNLTVQAEIPILRVGILLDCKAVTFSSEKGLHIYEIPSMKSLFRQGNSHPLIISADTIGIKINDKLYGAKKGIKIISEAGGLIQIENRKYRGEIEIINDQVLLDVINVIEVEKYLYGVLKKEISPEWPEEVLKAQAIAARTFALSNVNKYIDKGYNICSTTNSQAYGGVYHEHSATNKAVDDTKGIVITYEDKPINAVYHSDSGGYTENSENVWGGYEPYLRGVPSSYEEMVSPPNHCWDYSLTEQEILTKFNQKGFQFTRIDNITIGEKTEAGRAKSIDIVGGNYQRITMKTNDFRLLIGPTLVRSSLFTIDKIGERIEESKNVLNTPEQENQFKQKSARNILKEERDFSISELIGLLNRPKEKEPEKISLPEVVESIKSVDIIYTFKGYGSGHGVGLSQWGAYGMAIQGYGYEEILKYYYQGVQLKKIY